MVTWELFGNFIDDSSDSGYREILSTDIILPAGLDYGEPNYSITTIDIQADANGVLKIANPVDDEEINYFFNGNDEDNYIISGPKADAVIGRGGTDTVSYENSTSGVTVNLSMNRAYDGYGSRLNAGEGANPEDQFEIVVGIENVVGSDGADIIIGDERNNEITGGDGRDYIDGGNGIDTAVFDGIRAAYTISPPLESGETVVFRVNGETDVLKSVEILKFADGLFDISEGDVPRPEAPDLTAFDWGLSGVDAQGNTFE